MVGGWVIKKGPGWVGVMGEVCIWAGVRDDKEEWWDQWATNFGKALLCCFVLAAQWEAPGSPFGG